MARGESNASIAAGGKASKQSNYKRNETGLFEGGSTSAAQTIKSKFKRTKSKVSKISCQELTNVYK